MRLLSENHLDLVPHHHDCVRALIHHSYRIFLQIKKLRNNGRIKNFCYGIISLNGVYIKVGVYHPSFSMPTIKLLLLGLRDLLLDSQFSNANIQVVSTCQFPINNSKVKINLRMLWQDMMKIKSNLNELSFVKLLVFPHHLLILCYPFIFNKRFSICYFL